MENSRKGLPTQTTNDCALVMTVLKTHASQMVFVGFNEEPSSVVASSVLIKMALNSSPVKTIHLLASCY